MKPDNAAFGIMTLGSSNRESNLDVFKLWASERGLTDAADHLLCAINAEQTSRFLPDILHFLVARSSDLTRWEESGHHTFGLADLSQQLIGQESFATHGGRRLLSNRTLSDFPQSQDTHYLQMALVSNSPKENPPAKIDRYQNFRLWLLLEAMSRAAEGVILDRNLKVVAKVIRQAGEDQQNKKWRPFLMSILGFHENTTAIRLHLLSTGTMLMGGKNKLERGTAQFEFVEAMLAVARGIDDDYTTTFGVPPKRPSIYIDRSNTDGDQTPPVTEFDEFLSQSDDDDQEDQSRPSHLGQKSIQFGTVDPNENAQEQELTLTSITLTNAAKARLVAWDWDCINPIERIQLRRRIRLAYQGHSSQQQLVAAVTEICLSSGRSMNIGLQMRIGTSPHLSDEWCLDLSTGELMRKPPRRRSHARPKKQWGHLIPDEAQAVCIKLSSQCIQVIRAAFTVATRTEEITLSDLFANSKEAPTKMFLDWLREDRALRRTTPGMLGSVAQSTSFEEHADWLQSRLIYSQKNEGLPAAGSYGCYRQAEIKGRLISSLPANQNLNAAGGRIDASESFFQEGLQKLFRQIEVLADSPDYLEFSNFVSVYWDELLTCASGARPGDNLWVWKNIDWDDHFAWIDDKTGIDDHAARWVPLPVNLLTEIAASFRLTHAPTISALLIEEFGVEVSQQARGMLERGLCILIRDGSAIRAETVNSQTRKCVGQFDPLSPFVNNAYRHRARNEWRRRGLEPEIIDGFMSHGDGATRTHGDFSPRVWKRDAERARPIIEASFEALNPKYPSRYRYKQSALPTPISAIPSQLTGEETHTQKTIRRWTVLMKSARQATREISSQIIQADISYLIKLQQPLDRLSLNDVRTGLAGLDEKVVRRLTTALMQTNSHMPSTLGEFKLLWLSRMVEQVWERISVKVPLHKKAYRILIKDAPTANRDGIGARKRVNDLRLRYEHICRQTRRSEVTAIDAATLVAIDLCINSRIADCALLEDAVLGKVKIVEYQGRYFLEWGGGQPEIPDGRGVIRIRVTANSAFYISVIQEKSILRHTVLSLVTKKIELLAIDLVGIEEAATLSLSGLFTRLARTIDALNCIELPGNVAAFRGGRLRTAALSWRDWLRLESGKDFDTRKESPSAQAAETEDESSIDPLSVTPLLLASDVARKTAKSLFSDMRTTFSELHRNGLNVKATASVRRDLKRNLRRIINSYGDKVSPAIQMLADWCLSLFDRRGKGKKLNPSSIERYLGALSPSFEALFHSMDLRVLDEDQLTEALTGLFSNGNIKHPEYVKDRLTDFIHYCQEAHGLGSPNWHELQVHDKAIGISPGYVTFSQYARLLVQICRRSDLSPDDATRCGIFAILGYRFGLRKAEAAGLRWIDWIDVHGLIYVAVDSLRNRDVKHDSSRRTVPLLYKLTSFEKRLLQEHALLMNQHIKAHPYALALSYPENPSKPVDADRLASSVTSALKLVGGRHLTDHHLRHTFAANVWRDLEQLDDVSGSKEALEMRHRRRQLMLQSTESGRRTPWVIARLLGHAHPMTSYKSYIHFLCSYADDLTYSDTLRSNAPKAWRNLVRLEEFPQLRRIVVRTPSTKLNLPIPSTRVIVSALRLLSNGTQPTLVARSLHVSEQWVEIVKLALTGLESRIFPAPNDVDENTANPEQQHHNAKRSVSDPAQSNSGKKRLTFSKVGATGLLSHLLISRVNALTDLLEESLEKRSDVETPSMCALEEFCESFGPRLQVSVWTQSQMEFFRWAVFALGINKNRLTLLRSKVISTAVFGDAVRTGWIESGNDRQELNSGDPFPLTPVHGRQDTVRYGQYSARIDSRFSLQFQSNETLPLGSKFELMFCLLVCWAWVQARSKNYLQ